MQQKNRQELKDLEKKHAQILLEEQEHHRAELKRAGQELDSRCAQFRSDLEQKDAQNAALTKAANDKFQNDLAERNKQLKDLQAKYQVDLTQ